MIIAQLFETAQLTRTNAERMRMELANLITTIGKETKNHTEKIIAAVAHPAQPAAQRHIHVIDFNTSRTLLYMATSFIVILCGGINEQEPRDLNAHFYDSERRTDRRSLRQQVERYETTVWEAIDNQQRSAIREQKAEDIRQKTKQLQKKSDIPK